MGDSGSGAHRSGGRGRSGARGGARGPEEPKRWAERGLSHGCVSLLNQDGYHDGLSRVHSTGARPWSGGDGVERVSGEPSVEITNLTPMLTVQATVSQNCPCRNRLPAASCANQGHVLTAAGRSHMYVLSFPVRR